MLAVFAATQAQGGAGGNLTDLAGKNGGGVAAGLGALGVAGDAREAGREEPQRRLLIDELEPADVLASLVIRITESATTVDGADSGAVHVTRVRSRAPDTTTASLPAPGREALPSASPRRLRARAGAQSGFRIPPVLEGAGAPGVGERPLGVRGVVRLPRNRSDVRHAWRPADHAALGRIGRGRRVRSPGGLRPRGGTARTALRCGSGIWVADVRASGSPHSLRAGCR